HHLPDTPDVGVNKGLLALAIGSLLAVLLDLLRLLRRQWKSNRPELVNLQARQHARDAAADAERAVTVDFRQAFQQAVRNRPGGHGILPRLVSASCVPEARPCCADDAILRIATTGVFPIPSVAAVSIPAVGRACRACPAFPGATARPRGGGVAVP